MVYRLTLENDQYNQYSNRMINRNEQSIRLLRTSKITNPSFFKTPQNLNDNNFRNSKINKSSSFPDITGKGKFINEYI
ncbi:hypothetical protein ACQKP0_11965 [Heyndrickxia sp. NPDC080065]|uniref:hypothetical protein n=1 Tax=Heyndrickxia sp. NPDC080065 TaxID=3390568 RepID=UPI003D0073D7